MSVKRKVTVPVGRCCTDRVLAPAAAHREMDTRPADPPAGRARRLRDDDAPPAYGVDASDPSDSACRPANPRLCGLAANADDPRHATDRWWLGCSRWWRRRPPGRRWGRRRRRRCCARRGWRRTFDLEPSNLSAAGSDVDATAGVLAERVRAREVEAGVRVTHAVRYLQCNLPHRARAVIAVDVAADQLRHRRIADDVAARDRTATCVRVLVDRSRVVSGPWIARG
jgi:hypothetical protein